MPRLSLGTLLGTSPAGTVWPRPPGAVEEAHFKALCTRCGDCTAACPHGAIGALGDGTPAMDPNRAPCHLCDGLPCVASCGEEALEPVTPELVFLGLARILPEKCFPFQGPECGSCRPACPSRAITLVRTRPVIDSDRCSGCGLCKDACPVFGGAVVVDL